MNELALNNMSSDELDLLMSQAMQLKVGRLENRVKQLEDDRLKDKEETSIYKEELDNKIDDLQQDNEKKLEVAINTYRVNRNKWGFESQADFGTRFRVSIGAKTVGKLFKVIGLAKTSKNGRTEPLRSCINSGKATTEIVNGYETFRWHHEKCIKALESWLSDNELLEDFYSIDKEKDLQIFINDLYDRFVDDY